MEPLRLDPVPARVLAWHNRHPLARRIGPEHVGSMGYVALPFVQRPGKRGLRRGFDEDFLEGAPLGPLGRWAARHGVPSPEPPADGPLREVKVAGDRFAPGDTAVTLYVRTAFVDDGTQAGRLLIGGGDPAAVYGRRLPSRPRRLAAGGVLAALLAGVGLLLLPLFHHAAPSEAPQAAQAASEPVAMAASAASAVEPHAAPLHASAEPASAAASAAEPVVVAHASAPEAATRPPEAPASAAQAERPVDVEPRWGRIDMPSIRPTLHGDAPAVRPPPVAAPADDGPVWALATRGLRTDAESEQATVAIGALLQRAGLRAQKVQVLEMGGSRHVVVYPFPNQGAADNARRMLAGRGFQTVAVEF